MKQYKKDHCPDCGAKYAVKVADWTCPVCETEHPERPKPTLRTVEWPVKNDPSLKWVMEIPEGSWYDE